MLARRVDRIAAASSASAPCPLLEQTTSCAGAEPLEPLRRRTGGSQFDGRPSPECVLGRERCWWDSITATRTAGSKPLALVASAHKLDHWQAHGVVATSPSDRGMWTRCGPAPGTLRRGDPHPPRPPLGLAAVPDRLDSPMPHGSAQAGPVRNGTVTSSIAGPRRGKRKLISATVGCDVLITIQVGTHGGCAGQAAELRLGDLILAGSAGRSRRRGTVDGRLSRP